MDRLFFFSLQAYGDCVVKFPLPIYEYVGIFNLWYNNGLFFYKPILPPGV